MRVYVLLAQKKKTKAIERVNDTELWSQEVHLAPDLISNNHTKKGFYK